MVRVLDEYLSEQIVNKYYLTVDSRRLTIGDLDTMNTFPCYLKIMSDNAVHKMKSGAVFRIKDEEDLEDKKRLIEKNYKKLDGKYLIEQEEIKGEEFIIGIKDDDKFGYVIMLGIGGHKAEELKDVSFRKIPIRDKDAEEMIDELKNQAIVKRVDKKILANALIKLQRITKHYNLKFLDINPLKVDKIGRVVDARLYLK